MRYRRDGGDAQDLGLAIVMLCGLNGWNPQDLSRESGVDGGLIGDYVKGGRTPAARNLERIAAAFRIEPSFLGHLAGTCRRIRLTYERAAREGAAEAPAPGSAEGFAAGLEKEIAAAAMAALAPYLLELSQLDLGSPRAEDRSWAEDRWARVEPAGAEDQDLLVDVLLGDERSWALAERICTASAAAPGADEALRLARLAVRLAREVPGEDRFRNHLLGLCESFVAKALRAEA